MNLLKWCEHRTLCAAEGKDNTVPFILDAVRAYATGGEIFGSYNETSVL